MILTPEQLQDLGMAVFREAGVPEEAAASVVEALAFDCGLFGFSSFYLLG